MNNKGFTLVEILAVLIILGLLLVVTIPIYQNVLSGVKRSDYNSKVKQIEIAADKYGETIKDEVKKKWDASLVENSTNNCLDTSVKELIQKGLLLSEDEKDDVIYNPTDGKPLSNNIKICYCARSFEIKSYYLENFDSTKLYYAGEKFVNGGKVYQVDYDYNPKIGATITQDLKNKNVDTDAKLKSTYCSNCGSLSELNNSVKSGMNAVCYERNEKTKTIAKKGACFSQLIC